MKVNKRKRWRRRIFIALLFALSASVTRYAISLYDGEPITWWIFPFNLLIGGLLSAFLDRFGIEQQRGIQSYEAYRLADLRRGIAILGFDLREQQPGGVEYYEQKRGLYPPLYPELYLYKTGSVWLVEASKTHLKRLKAHMER